MRNKHARSKGFLSSLSQKHHFSNPNTLEIILSLVFMAAAYRLVEFVSRGAKY